MKNKTQPAKDRATAKITINIGLSTKDYLECVPEDAGDLVDALVTIYRMQYKHTSPDEVQAFVDSVFGRQK